MIKEIVSCEHNPKQTQTDGIYICTYCLRQLRPCGSCFVIDLTNNRTEHGCFDCAPEMMVD